MARKRVGRTHGQAQRSKNEEAILASAPREKIWNPDVEQLVIKGFHTNYGGAFLLLPYLAALDLDKLVCNLGIENQQGIATLQNVLSLVLLAVAGKNISAI